MTLKGYLLHKNAFKKWTEGWDVEFYDKDENMWIHTSSPSWRADVDYMAKPPTFIPGERILVKDYDMDKWEKRFFIKMDDGKYGCASEVERGLMLDSKHNIIITGWDEAKRIIE